jgi:hypothetical protein
MGMVCLFLRKPSFYAFKKKEMISTFFLCPAEAGPTFVIKGFMVPVDFKTEEFSMN